MCCIRFVGGHEYVTAAATYEDELAGDETHGNGDQRRLEVPAGLCRLVSLTRVEKSKLGSPDAPNIGEVQHEVRWL